MAFNKENFEQSFKKSLSKLKSSEKVTRAELMLLSRSVLEATHETGDVAYINKLLAVLTPMNKRTAILYFKEFSGFQNDGEQFTKKDKKNYDACLQATQEFLEVPSNNIWTWAERNVTIEKTPFTLDQVKKTMSNFLKKADDAGVKRSEILAAVFGSGFSIEEIVETLNSMEGMKVDATIN